MDPGAKFLREIAIYVACGIIALEIAGPLISLVDPTLGIGILGSSVVQASGIILGILCGSVAALVTMMERPSGWFLATSSLGIFCLMLALRNADCCTIVSGVFAGKVSLGEAGFAPFFWHMFPIFGAAAILIALLKTSRPNKRRT